MHVYCMPTWVACHFKLPSVQLNLSLSRQHNSCEHAVFTFDLFMLSYIQALQFWVEAYTHISFIQRTWYHDHRFWELTPKVNCSKSYITFKITSLSIVIPTGVQCHVGQCWRHNDVTILVRPYGGMWVCHWLRWQIIANRWFDCTEPSCCFHLQCRWLLLSQLAAHVVDSSQTLCHGPRHFTPNSMWISPWGRC